MMEKRAVSILLLVFYLSCSANGRTRVRLPKIYSRSCQISVCEDANSYCGRVRDGKLKMQRTFYKLTKMISNPNAKQLPMPVLDQPVNLTMQYFLIDKFDAQCFNLLFLVLGKARAAVSSAAMKQFQTQRFTTFQQYDAIGELFKKGIGIYNPMLSKYFRDPSLSYPFMKDLRKGNFFLSDEYFVQGQLAGMNVMAIRRVTRRGKIGTNFKALKQRLNPNFKWAKAISSVTRRGFWQSISARMVYVAEFPLLSGLQNIPDPLAKHFPPGVKMIPQTNPIAIFGSRYNQRKRRYELKPVAIQIDDKQDSQVYTPSDGFNWQVAKALHLTTGVFHGQFHEHLLQTHLKMEPICVILNRQISDHHPLHEILKYHCRGMLPLNANAGPSFFGESGSANIMFGFGSPGAIKLVQRGFKKMIWNDIDLENNLKQRGMNDRKKIPFYPYRDDGRVVNRVLKKFAREFVDLYYEFDRDVFEDQELQNFVNEVSLKGKKPPNNGIGGVRGLPSHFGTKNQLARFLAEVLWIQVQHAAITYPPMVYGDSVSLASSKLYNDSRGYDKKDFAYLLPGPIAAIVQTNQAMAVGAYHYDNLFDYGDELRDQPMKRLVAKTYRELMEKVKPLLDRRNVQRLKRGQVSYPFFVPGWVSNSIST